MAYTVITTDTTVQKKAVLIARLIGAHFIACVTDGVKTGVFVSTPWTDSKFIAIFLDGSFLVATPAEALNVLGQVAAAIP